MVKLSFLIATLLAVSEGRSANSRAPWCIARGGAASNYASQLEGVKGSVLEKAGAAVSF